MKAQRVRQDYEMTSFKIDLAPSWSSDTQRFVTALDQTNDPWGDVFFNPGRTIIVTRAPGRLDVMGGIADYSGSLVLQLPIRNATHVALQKSDHTKARLLSLGSRSERRFVEIDLTEFQNAKNEPITYADARKRFSDSREHWVSYAVGAFLVLMREKDCEFSTGAAILIQSNVPEGKGVSSSAALEVAVMQAINVAYGIGLNAQEIARLLGEARDAPGCRIFIGSENRMFALSGSSVIAAPYRGSQGQVVGVVGVIGPTRLNYARVVPMVDFTAKALTRLMA